MTRENQRRGVATKMVRTKSDEKELSAASAVQARRELPSHFRSFHLGYDRPHVCGTAHRNEERALWICTGWLRSHNSTFRASSAPDRRTVSSGTTGKNRHFRDVWGNENRVSKRYARSL